MSNQINIKKAFAASLIAVSVPFILGASTISGTTGETKKNSKYSLSNLSLYSKKAINFNLFKSPSLYSGSSILNQQTNTPSGIQINTSMQFNRGNTTYIFPYKLKLKVSKFKLPAPTPTH
ncbi:MAG: hypothetical protein ACOVMM_07905 [Chitinophagaceae bacterium]